MPQCFARPAQWPGAAARHVTYPGLHALLAVLLPAAILLPLSAVSGAGASSTDATWSAAAWADLQPVGSEVELVAAVRNASCVGARLTDNIRLTAGAWPATPIVRTSNFTVNGDNQSYILDMSFIESKVKMAPGVAFMFVQIEVRNTRQRSGFEADIFSASPGSYLIYDDVVYHCFSCLPPTLLYGIMTALPPAGTPQNVTMLLPPAGSSSSSNSTANPTGGTPAPSLYAWRHAWCRARPAVLAACYSGAQVLDIATGSLELAVSGLAGVASGGGYVLLGRHVYFVCEDPSTEECGNSQGYDYCVRTKIQDIYSRDTTWAQLAAAAAAQNSSTTGGNGDSGSNTGAVVGAAVGGAVGGCLLLAAVGALVVYLRRRRQRGQQQQQQQQRGQAQEQGHKTPGTADADGLVPAGTGSVGGGAGAGAGAANGAGHHQEERVPVDTVGGDSGRALQQVVVVNGASGAAAHGAAAVETWSGSQAAAPAAAAASGAGGGSSGTADGDSTSLGLTAAGTNTNSAPGGAASAAAAAANGSAANAAAAAPAAVPAPGTPGAAVAAAASGAMLPMPPMPAAAAGAAAGSLPRTGSSNANGRHGGGGSGGAASGAAAQQPAAAATGTGSVIVAGICIDLTTTLGTGSFGKVFRGSWPAAAAGPGGPGGGRPAAVKVLQYGTDLQRAVHNEVLLSQTLSHPNLVASLYFAQVLPGGRLGLTSTASANSPTGVSHCAAVPSVVASPASASAPTMSGTGTPPVSGRRAAGAGSGGGGGSGGSSSGTTAPAAAAAAAAAAAVAATGLNVVRIGSGPSSAVAQGCGSSKQGLLQHKNSNSQSQQLQPNQQQQRRVLQPPPACGAAGGGGARGAGGGPPLARCSEPPSVHASARDLQVPAAAEAADAAQAAAAAAAAGGPAAACSGLDVEGPPLQRKSAPAPGGGRGPGGQQGAPGLDQLGWADLEQEGEQEEAGGGQQAAGRSGDPRYGGDNSSGGGASSGTQDVLSRWAEQRRRQEVLEEQGGGGARLLVAAGGLTEVTPNGYVVAPVAAEVAVAAAGGLEDAHGTAGAAQAAVAVAGAGGMAEVAAAAGQLVSGEGGGAAAGGPVAPGAAASAALAAFHSEATTAVGGGDTATAAYVEAPSQPSHPGQGPALADPGAAAAQQRPPAPKSGAAAGVRTGATNAVTAGAGGGATTALPLEALWLAAHTQPAAGSSHGFLVMELCEGGSAFAWRAGHWRHPEDRPDLAVLLRLALDVAYGMAYVHSLGVCHGDLKLSNVLLARQLQPPPPPPPPHAQQHSHSHSQSASGPTSGACSNGNSGAGGGGGASRAAGGRRNGSSGATAAAAAAALEEGPNDRLTGWTAKICDFGLSRVLTGERTHVSTRPYGTPTHMAPELWTKGHVSQPADVYAYGILLWELATGERPYKGLNAARILHRVLLSGGRPALPLWLPPSYTRLASQCWAQSPKDRPSFPDIVRHLEAMLAVLAAVTPQTS